MSAIIASLCIYLYTVLFSLYTNIFMDNSGIYGGISAFISVMLWVYGSMYIIILGFRLSVFMNMIYQKNFWSIERVYTAYNQSSRQRSLLEVLDLMDRYIVDDGSLDVYNDEPIDYMRVTAKIAEFKKDSLAYLDHALALN